MYKPFRLPILLSLALVTAGCESSSVLIADAAVQDSPDAVTEGDAQAFDAGERSDGGAGVGDDAATTGDDASTTLADVGSPGGDAGDAPVDAGVGQPDVGAARPASLTASAGLVFAPMAVGRTSAEQSVTITNGGEEAASALGVYFALGGVGASDFVLQPSAAGDCVPGVTALAPGAGCSLRFTFQPSAAGARSASLIFSAASGGTGSVSLSGSALTPAALGTPSLGLVFAPTLAGQASSEKSVTITNAGEETSSALTVGLSGLEPESFTLQPAGPGDCVSGSTVLAHGESCVVRVVFSSPLVGPHGALLTFGADVGGADSVPLEGTAIAPANLGTTTPALTFAPTVVGETSREASFVVTNTGEQSSSGITLTMAGANAADFTLQPFAAGDCLSGTTTLAPGQSCAVRAVFSPTAAGTRTASLSFAAATGGSGSVALSGTTLSPAAVGTTSTDLSFASTVVGGLSAEASFTLTNGGEATSSPITLALGGTAPRDFTLQPFASGDCVSGATRLAQGESCTVRVVFAPIAPGSRSASVGFSATAGGSGSVSLVGVGLAPADLVASTAALSFPDTGVGHSAELSLTLTNAGDVPSSVITLARSGTNPSNFVLPAAAAGDCVSGTTLLAAGQGCTIRVAFKPPGLGGRSASLTYSAATGGGGTIALAGTGVTPALLTTTATGLSFEMTGVGLTSAEQGFVVTNEGAETSSPISVWIGGATRADFVVPPRSPGDCLSAGLPGGGACFVRVVFKPTVYGSRSATVSFSAGIGGSGRVSLDGFGDGVWSPAGSVSGRSEHTATRLRDGKVLVAGGRPTTAYVGSMLYDPVAGTWTPTNEMTTPRFAHTATLLRNGKVLVVGGDSSANSYPVSAEVYDPTTGTWSTTGSLTQGRRNHAAVLLPSGKVLVVGGTIGFSSGTHIPTASAELYDPATGKWSTAFSMAEARGNPSATLLGNGKVLLLGGSARTELYDPIAGTVTLTGYLHVARESCSAALLEDGRVLVSGGSTASGALKTAEVYETGLWTPIPAMGTARLGHELVPLPNGKVLAIGGLGYETSVELFDPALGTWSATQPLAIGRTYATATLLESGKVLVVGGQAAGGGYPSTAEVYDPNPTAPGSWTSTLYMATGRRDHTATLLPDGEVLVAGGADTAGASMANAEVYVPRSGSWAPTNAMSAARSRHTAVLLPTGKVLVSGGISSGVASSAELYTPSSGTWAPTGSMQDRRYSHTATLLNDGTVLVVGGYSTKAEATAEIYASGTGAWSSTSSLTTGRHGHTATLLADGRVLVTGGQNATYLASAEIYNPVARTWSSASSMTTTRRDHTATLLANGKVLVVGGYNGSASNMVQTVELFDPATGTWTSAPSWTPRRSHTAIRLASGKVLVTGGSEAYGALLTDTALYDPVSNTWSVGAALADARSHHTMTLLETGEVLVTGGGDGDAFSSAEVYHP